MIRFLGSGRIVSAILLWSVLAGCGRSNPAEPEVVKTDQEILREEFYAFAEEIRQKSLAFSNWDKTSGGYFEEYKELQADYAEFEEIRVLLYEEYYMKIDGEFGRLEIVSEFPVREYGRSTFGSSGKGRWRLDYRKKDGQWLITDSSFFGL